MGVDYNDQSIKIEIKFMILCYFYVFYVFMYFIRGIIIYNN